MTSEPGSAAMEQFEPLEKVFIRWARGADGSLNIRKWSQFPFDGATEYGDPVVLTRERDEAREALKLVREWFAHISDDDNIVDAADEADKMADVQIAVDAALSKEKPE